MAGRNRVFVLAAFLLAGCGANPQGAYYEPSPERFAFDYENRGASFSDYVTAHGAYIAKHRVYYDPDNRTAELERILPYEMPTPAHCDAAEPKKGVLLIHGVAGTAHAMKDIGDGLNQKCVAVKSLVLDGHATRAGDLLDVDKRDWIAGVDFGIRSLAGEVDEVYVAGFSLGGLLAVNAATRHEDLAGLVLFAPALEIHYPRFLSWQARWLRFFRKWIDVEPNGNPVKYLSLTTDAAAEIVELKTGTFRAMRRQGGLSPPVLAYLTEYDLAIDAPTVLDILHRNAGHAKSRLVYYLTWSQGADATGISDVEYRSAFFPEDKVLNFSHFSFVHAPDNPVFGAHGSHRDCGQEHTDFIPPDEVARCFALADAWKGELGTHRWAGGAGGGQYAPLQRLTYHPRFSGMMEEIAAFMGAGGGQN